jgi:uncharacterized DUF497 family protein
MHRITGLEWDDASREHIDRHGVTPQEVEEVCFSRPVLMRSRHGTRLAYGQTLAGRYLLVVLRLMDGGVARCITARTMTDKERRFCARRSRRL